ncbi:MAG TPA: magnesium transporter CorA family protein [Candidatus Onthocola stercorigallinarum]|nr:magnesium transporter CorA family protein [Candidatus Onthocola stercorigallinarum]
MISILKSKKNSSDLEKCSKIEKNTWINLVKPSEKEIKEVANALKIDTNIISQVLVEKELPRVKKLDNATLIVVDVPFMKDTSIKNKYVTYPLGIIVSNTCITTVSLVEHAFLNNMEDINTFEINKLLIEILLKSAQSYLITLESIDEDIVRIENNTYKATDNKQLLNFLNIQKTLVYFITSLHANGMVLEKLQKENMLDFSKEEAMLLEDATLENKQSIETSTVYREILSSTMDTYSSIISNNLNVLMKFLTGITIVFSVPTMIASFLGMNVPLGELGENPASFALIILISLIISLCIAWWLKKKNML